jgi:hypothetical protein
MDREKTGRNWEAMNIKIPGTIVPGISFGTVDSD